MIASQSDWSLCMASWRAGCCEDIVRIVHLLPSTDDAGAENQARYLLREFRDRLPDVMLELVYFRVGRAHERFCELGVPMHALPPHRNLAVDGRRRARVLHSLLADRNPDVLHTWLYEANVIGARALPGWPDTSLVMTQRSGDYGRDDFWRLRVMRRLYSRAGHILANSEEGIRLLLDVGCESSRVSVIPNAIPPERTACTRSREDIRSELRIAPDAPVVCAVGRADETKDLPTLMSALALVHRRVPNVRLVLVGAVEADLPRLGVELPPYALALGWQAHPADLMAASDVLAMASRTEGHSNVADEALMLGLPVAATDTGAHPTLVRRAGGRVVPVRDAVALAEAIVALLADPPNPEQVRHTAARELAPLVVFQETVATYRRVLARSGRDVPSALAPILV
jgi:glycosyltransferase involved in cell wall biosynthesis